MTSQDFLVGVVDEGDFVAVGFDGAFEGLEGGVGRLAHLSSGLAMVSCATTVKLNIRQAARMGINSFFIVVSLLDDFENLDSCSSTKQAEDWMQGTD